MNKILFVIMTICFLIIYSDCDNFKLLLISKFSSVIVFIVCILCLQINKTEKMSFYCGKSKDKLRDN